MEALDREDMADGMRAAKKPGWFLVSYRAALLLGVYVGVGYFWLYADSHNDARYVKRDDYERDKKEMAETHDRERASDAAIEAMREASTADKMAGMEKWLSEISGDVKELLKENRNNNK